MEEIFRVPGGNAGVVADGHGIQEAVPERLGLVLDLRRMLYLGPLDRTP